ncbi:putative bifunctional diguanylate cyclase/phosphodiesterase [Motilimonas eburnea]|uniref:putative bifunctional diguanylate cyclase/phosphodiesterase n=1 Tax=Motilimonas eburnea TaxID=1737488 RepID=UPI001E5DD026|nr:GGDEF domain-containing phosphodiesterase [Motilimonas eburnea]MCE2572520.1 EAL domain-containing protein [Motilimonas eburnea]
MSRKTFHWQTLMHMETWVSIFYYVAVASVFSTLYHEHQVYNYLYVAFPLLLIFAKRCQFYLFKCISAVLALLLVVIGGLFDPIHFDAVEETFILLPLVYVILFPHSLWPIASALVMLLVFYLHLPAAELDEYIEDAIELIAITSFASVMAFFQQKLKQQMLNYRRESMTDYLTQLPNRKGFYADLAKFKLQGHQSEQRAALLQIDLDGFKRINDNMGHNIGDLVLQEFAKRLQQTHSNWVSSYRIGGDEFAVLVKPRNDLVSEAEALAHQILGFSTLPYTFMNREYHLTASIGIALYQDASGLNDIWCRNADIAMYRSKEYGKNTFHWFDHQLIQETIRRYQLEKELLLALEQSQFYLVYQPKVSIATHQVVGVEALIRWHHPQLGLIPPADFIPIAEDSQQIIVLGRWVMEASCRQAKRWLDSDMEVVVSVNVSAVQLAHDDTFEMISQALSLADLPPRLLQIEITETAIMENPETIIVTLARLRDLGVKVAIDDFGVAYSSLNYLRRLPVDVLKIDKSFVDDCVTNHKDKMIVRTVVQLGHNLDVQVTAEGVEDQAQLALLAEEGCDMYQGYLFSPPVSAEQIILMIQNEAP